MLRPIRNRPAGLAAGLALFLLVLLAADVARAQCLITGSTSLCNGSVQLCGPEGWEYMWIDPAGNFSFERCLTAAEPGTYMLRITDPFGESFGPCMVTLESPPPPPPSSISGPTTGCDGSTVELCGPAGEYAYSWSGPSGFASASACVQVGVSGTYRLSVRRTSDDCPASSSEHTVAFSSCEPPPPPPPPPPDTLPSPAPPRENCPQTASFWMRQCLPGRESAARMDPALLADIASHIDGFCLAFDWNDPREGFCAAVHPRKATLRANAKRQFAAVHANVCAGEMGLPPVSGRLIALDPATRVHVGGTRSTVGEWLDAADARLAELEVRDRGARDVKEAYRSIIRVGWHINHGHGIGAVCGRRGEPGDGDDHAAVLDTDAEEPLEAELADEAEVESAAARATPNPFSRATTVTYVVSGGASQMVSIAIYDLAGRKVIDLASGLQDSGTHDVRWDGRSANGAPVRSGVYFVRGVVGAQRLAGQLTLLH